MDEQGIGEDGLRRVILGGDAVKPAWKNKRDENGVGRNSKEIERRNAEIAANQEISDGVAFRLAPSSNWAPA